MSRPRVVITGLGQVSSLGSDLEEFWSLVSEGPPLRVDGTIHEVDDEGLPPKVARRADPFTRYAMIAAGHALVDAGLDPTGVDPRRAGLILATVYGALRSMDEEAEALVTGGAEAVTPNLAVQACENIAGATISAHLGWRGPCRTIVTACAGGTHAISEAADLIWSGRLEVALAGGTQGPISPVLMASYRNLRVLSPSGWVRPFDRRRDGFAFAEGSAILVLETLERARSRGARVYAEVLGSGHTNDAASLVSPSGPGATDCIRDALDDASLDPADIVHVNAHGTGTVVNDLREAEALHAVFGSRPPATSSIKRILGHAAGASGAFEAVAAALTVQTGLAPSLGSDVEEDESLELDLVIGPPRPVPSGPVLSNSFGLGGQNGTIILGPVNSSPTVS